MTNTIAIWIGAILLALFAVDYVLFDWAILIAFMRVFLEFIDFLAVWR